MYLEKSYRRKAVGRERGVDGFPVPLRDFGFVAVMRTGLLDEIADLLSRTGAALPVEPILCSCVDGRFYGDVRLTAGLPSPEALAGVAGDAPFVAPLEVCRLSPWRPDAWRADTALCGFDLRRMRDRLRGMQTPSLLPPRRTAWVPGYGPRDGFMETLSRGCLVHLYAMLRRCGYLSGIWRRVDFPPVRMMMDAALPPLRQMDITALRMTEGSSGTTSLQFYAEGPGIWRWMAAEELPLTALYETKEMIDRTFDGKDGCILVMP